MRLHELHINNFKFFPKQDPNSPLLKIDGKNLLVYGENGSGNPPFIGQSILCSKVLLKSMNLM
jgi:hypothetical protein